MRTVILVSALVIANAIDPSFRLEFHSWMLLALTLAFSLAADFIDTCYVLEKQL